MSSKKKHTVSAVKQDEFRRKLALIFLPVTRVRLKCLLDSGAEIYLLDYDVMLSLDPSRYVFFPRRDVFIGR